MKSVVINGRSVLVETDTLEYSELVYMAGFNPFNTVFTVAYARAPGAKQAGTLTPGQLVEIADGTVFNVADTSAA